MIIGIYSTLPLIIAFGKILWLSILSLFKEPKKQFNMTQTSEISTISLFEELISQPTNENNQEEDDEHKPSLLDPCNLLNMRQYENFLNDPEVNHFYLFFKRRKFDVKMIPGFLILLIVIAYVITMNLYDYYNTKNNYKALDYVYSVFISLIYIFSIPFLMIFNIACLFMDWKTTKERHGIIRIIWILTSIVYILLLIAGYVFISLVTFKVHPFVPSDLIYTNYSNSVQITEPVAFCDLKYYGLDLIQYSGIAALGQVLDYNLSIEILKYLFNGAKMEIDAYANKYVYFYEVINNDTFSVISFNSNVNTASWDFLIENYFSDFVPNQVFEAIISFYYLSNISCLNL